MNQIQHGDVLIRKIKKLPAGVRQGERAPNGSLIIAEGEATGHHHVITAPKGATLWILPKDGIDQMYLEVTEPVTITHEEHKELPIPPGIYEIGRVREHDYFADMERRVVD
jgi:hypothetical protein